MKRVYKYNGYKQLIHINATPQWLAFQWERNKRPLAQTNGQQNISPTAIALSQAHRSGKKYGGNCTPKEFNELEKEKKNACGKERACFPNYSRDKLNGLADNAAQCAILRSIINNKCFAGGDGGHKTAERQAWRTFTKCFEILYK